MKQVQIAYLYVWKVIARVTQYLHLRRKTADCESGDQTLSGKIVLREDNPPVVRPGRNPIALIIEAHRVGVNLTPLRILQYKSSRYLRSK